MTRPAPIALVAVYNADGGIRGELAYVTGKLLRRAHCELCDISHSPVRRKPAWDALLGTLPIPLRAVHRDEIEPAVAEVVAGVGLPAVLAHLADGSVECLLTPAELDQAQGSVERFGGLLAQALSRYDVEAGGR